MEKQLLSGLLSEAELRAILANVIAIAVGFIMRVAVDWSVGRISAKIVIIQLMASLSVGYFLWKASFESSWIARYLEYLLGFSSLCAVEIINGLKSLGRDGIKGFIRKKINELGGKDHDSPDVPTV